MNLSSVPFWTPIESKGFSLGHLADSYFSFGGRVAQVVTPEQIEFGSKAAWKMQSKTCVGCIAFKVLTMVLSLGILPVIALVIKTVYRCTHKFHWVEGDQDRTQILRDIWAWDPVPLNPRHNLQNARQLFEKNQECKAAIEASVLANQDAFDERLNLWRNNRSIDSMNSLKRADVFDFFNLPDDLIEDESQVALVHRLIFDQAPSTSRKRSSPTSTVLQPPTKLARITA